MPVFPPDRLRTTYGGCLPSADRVPRSLATTTDGAELATTPVRRIRETNHAQ
jgi:hypothetical protein